MTAIPRTIRSGRQMRLRSGVLGDRRRQKAGIGRTHAEPRLESTKGIETGHKVGSRPGEDLYRAAVGGPGRKGTGSEEESEGKAIECSGHAEIHEGKNGDLVSLQLP
jgi:hypothetical protein